jgi:hypothetical protein
MKAHQTDSAVRTFLGIRDAASLAGFSARHFRRILKEKLVPRVKIGRRVFILGTDFERWQAERKASVVERD